MKIAIIDIGWSNVNPKNPFESALGGSETWLFQISEKFAIDNNVHLFFKFKDTNEQEYKVNDNLTYYNESTTQRILLQNKYDFVILSRFVHKNGINYIKFIKEHNIAKHCYLQVHDLSLMKEASTGEILSTREDVHQMLLDDDFLTIVTLNEWHKTNLLTQYKVPANHIICVPNGVDLSLLDFNIKQPKDNRILWSSCQERGLDILINDIYPLVKKYVPDFGIDVAGYNDISLVDTEDKDVRILGRLTKKQLYTEQKKHKVWFYPGVFAETFCITMIENIMNGAYVVSPMTYGTAGTLAPFVEKMRCGTTFLEKKEKAFSTVACAAQIIAILTNKQKAIESLVPLYDEIKEYIKENFNWTHSVDLYVNDFKTREYTKETSKKQKKILFLTMYCNHPFFEEQLQTVRDTWAKPLINGEVMNAEWYCFTACNDKHKKQEIDETTHTVYVDCDDSLGHTYTKMMKAYKMLSDAHPFDIMVRTNTSTYLNLDRILLLTDNLKDNEIANDWCGYYRYDENKELKYQFEAFVGNCYIANKTLLDKIFYSDYDEVNLGFSDGDDIVASKIMHLLNIDYKHVYLNPNDETGNQCLQYKRFLRGDMSVDLSTEDMNRHIDEPELVNKWTTISVRTKYVDLEERAKKGSENKHMRELHYAYEKARKVSTKHFKMLFLSMSCNDPFFILEEQVVKDTWAKPIIEGKYPDVGYFAYRSCDNEHPYECIDDNNTIYLNSLDDLKHTYTKTKRCFNFLKEQGYSWDYVVRTNTSAFWNVENTVNLYDKLLKGSNTVASTFGWYVPNDSKCACPSGWAMILPKSLTDLIAYENFDESLGSYKEIIGDRINNKKWFPYDRQDDIMIGLLMWLVEDKIKFNRLELGTYHYKNFYKDGPLADKNNITLDVFEKYGETITSADKVNDIFVAQVRCWGIKETRYLELEHIYELNNSLKINKL